MRRHYNVETAFVVPGDAVPQQRPRFSTICGHARAYDPAKSRDYKNLVRMASAQAMKDKPLFLHQCRLVISVYMQIPSSWSKKKQAQALEPGFIYAPTTRGRDLDNLAKSVMDGMTGVVYKDDSQVVSLAICKRYALKPMVEISLTGVVYIDSPLSEKEAESDGNDRE